MSSRTTGSGRPESRPEEPPEPRPDPTEVVQSGWTFLSNHAHVLIALAVEPDLRLREIAARVGITERSVQNLLADLEDEGLVTRVRAGRRNRYSLHLDRPLRHPLEAHCRVRELIEMVTKRRGSSPRDVPPVP